MENRPYHPGFVNGTDGARNNRAMTVTITEEQREAADADLQPGLMAFEAGVARLTDERSLDKSDRVASGRLPFPVGTE